MNITTLIQALGQAVAGFPEGANPERATAAVIRNGDLNYVAVFTDGDEAHDGAVALNVVGIPLVTLDDSELPDYVLDGVGNAAADYRGKQQEGLVP